MPSARELIRTNNWWDSKIPPVLAMFYATAMIYDVPVAAAVRGLALIVFVGICAGSYGHIINDVFDVEVDEKAGKPNQMARFAPWQRLAFCVLTLALGFVPALVFPYSRLSIALLCIEYLLPTVYSIPPLRLKERGALGVLCDSLGAHAVPCLYAVSVMANEAAVPPARYVWLIPALVVTGFVWSLCLGIKGIIIHEFEDRAGDLQAGVSTLATGLNFRAVRLPVNRVYVLELMAFAGLLAVLAPVAPILPVIVGFYILSLYTKVFRDLDFYLFDSRPEATVQWWQFSHPLYECYLPLALAVQLSWRHPVLALLPLVQIWGFRSNFRLRAREFSLFAGQLREWLVVRAQLHLDGGAAARLFRAGTAGARLEVSQGGTEPWHIRLVRPYSGIRAWNSYCVRLEARSGEPRNATLGVWQNHSPWTSLGLTEPVHLTPEWQQLEFTFSAVDDEEQVYLGFWVGGVAGSLDIRRLEMSSAKSPEPVEPDLRAPYRIYVGTTQWNLTGVNVYSEHLVRGLRSRGADARILLTERNTDLVQPSSDLIPLPDDVPVEDLPVAASATWPVHWVGLVRYLSRRAPCIYVPNADYRHSCVSPKLPPNVAVVGIVHSDDPLHYEHVARLGSYWDAIVCVSDTVARKVAELQPSLTARLHVISNGMPVPEVCPERPTDHAEKFRPLRVMYHGGLNTHQKRILDIAGVLNECEKAGVPVQITVAGDGSEREALLAACESHTRAGRFHYAGLKPHDEIETMLRQHDVYLLPSAFEGLPYALLEAMANGCVPVVTDIESAVPELIRHGVNGYRVPVGDVAAFAHYLGILNADRKLLAAMAVESHKTLLGSRYDAREMVNSYLKLFDRVLSAARNGVYKRPEGPILPPPREVSGISIFPMEHTREVNSAERWLMPKNERLNFRLRRLASRFF